MYFHEREREREREREERKTEYYFVVCIGSQTNKFILTIGRRRGEKLTEKVLILSYIC